MPGPKPNYKMIKKVHALKKQGLNKSEIARVVKKDRRQVRRWLGYKVGQDIHRS